MMLSLIIGVSLCWPFPPGTFSPGTFSVWFHCGVLEWMVEDVSDC